jgi:threonine dehydratase
VVAVTSGANINFERLRLVADLADLGAMTEAMLATTIPERQGAFGAFVDTATSNSGIAVTEFKYRCGGWRRGEWWWCYARAGLRSWGRVCWWGCVAAPQAGGR